MPREQITCPSKPREERHCRGSVEPGNVGAASSPTVGSAGSAVMRSMERQVNFERQMNVDRARQERNNTEGEAHQEAQQIEVRPRHSAPRNAAPRCVDWNPRRR